MDPPPASAMNPIPASMPHSSYAESVESSPRSRTTETWDDRESLSAAPGGGGKVRLMCSYGGHIIPRPHDKSLSYVGGDTRMVVVDRNISLGELKARLSKNLLHNDAFTLKYQLPNEDLDSLISVTSDEDLDNMIDEFDRICATTTAAKSSRLRVFLFPNTRESASSIELIFGGSVKSEDWFYNALNGSNASAKDAKSVNSLLGLESDSIAVNNGGNPRELETLQADLSKNQKWNNQDAPLNPDSVMIETSSSFGSTSSSLANLPPIRVRVEGGGVGGNKAQDQRVAVEEQFAQMGVSAGGKQDEGLAATASLPIPTTLTPSTMNPGMGGGELPERIVSDDDDERFDQAVSVGHGRTQTKPLLHTRSQPQQKHTGIFDIASPNSPSSDGSVLYQDPVAQLPSGISRKTSNPQDSNNPRMQVQQKVSESGYLLHSQLEQQHLQKQLQQLQQQQHQHNQQQQHQQNQQQQHQHNQQQQHQQNQQQHHHQNQHQQHRHQQNQHQQNQQHQHQQNQQNQHEQQQHQQHQQQQQHQQHQQHQQQQEHLQQQQQQQQEHLQQQQQQQHQQQQQQQHQQQQQQHHQFVHPGTHYIQHPHNAAPMSQYYQLYPPPTQHRQQQLDQQQYPFYFIPPTTRQPQQAYSMSLQQGTYNDPSNDVPFSRSQTLPVPNMTTSPSAYNNQPRNMAPETSEMGSSDYRAAIPNAQSMVHVAPGQHQQQYTSYSQVQHAPQTMAQPQNPATVTNSSYVYEYSDPTHAQMYCTQPLSHPSAQPAQYQTMASASPMVMLSDASSAQNPNDNMKHQNSPQSQ